MFRKKNKNIQGEAGPSEDKALKKSNKPKKKGHNYQHHHLGRYSRSRSSPIARIW